MGEMSLLPLSGETGNRIFWRPTKSQRGKGPETVKPNYEFAKRQRDLAKKAKKEEKKNRKLGEAAAPEPESVTPDPEAAKTPK